MIWYHVVNLWLRDTEKWVYCGKSDMQIFTRSLIHSGVRLLGISNFDLLFLEKETELTVLLITWGNSKTFCSGRQNVYVMKLPKIKHPYFLFMNNTRHFLMSCLKAWIIFSIFSLKAWIIFSTKLSKGKRPRRKTWKSKQRQRFNVNNLTFHFGNFEDRLIHFQITGEKLVLIQNKFSSENLR